MPLELTGKVVETRLAHPAVPINGGVPFLQRIRCIATHELCVAELTVIVIVVGLSRRIGLPN